MSYIPLYSSENRILSEVGSFTFSTWLNEAKKRKAEKIIVFRDEFDDYPYVYYLLSGEDKEEKIRQEISNGGGDMTTFLGVIEVKEI